MKVARSAPSSIADAFGQAHDELDEQRDLDGGADEDERVVDETAPEQVVRGQQAEHAARDEQHDGQGLEHASSLRRRSRAPGSGVEGWTGPSGRGRHGTVVSSRSTTDVPGRPASDHPRSPRADPPHRRRPGGRRAARARPAATRSACRTRWRPPRSARP